MMMILMTKMIMITLTASILDFLLSTHHAVSNSHTHVATHESRATQFTPLVQKDGSADSSFHCTLRATEDAAKV